MTIDELRVKLQALLDNDPDGREGHEEADALLLEFIGDDDVCRLHEELAIWYS